MNTKLLRFIPSLLLCLFMLSAAQAQDRRPIDNRHPMWMIHVDVWNNADPQKIIDLIPADIRPFVCINLSLSCQFDKERDVYKMPQNAVLTFDSWATVCCQNNMWFMCQPASGGHTHIQDSDLETLESFFIRYKNFLGWNYCEQFWGFDEAGDRSSSSQVERVAMFAKLVRISHKYGGFLTISFCGNIWSHPLSPVGMLKRDANFMSACKAYPEAVLFLYKYTQPWCFYNSESVCLGPWIAGLAKNYGIRYDQCGWEAAGKKLDGSDKHTYPHSVGIGTCMEQTAMNGACVWDGPELIWQECFRGTNNTTVDGYTRRNWGTFAHFDNIWIDMFRKIIDGTIYIPSRQEVIARTKVAILNDVDYASDNSGSKVNSCASTKTLYEGLYQQEDPVMQNGGYYMDDILFFKKTGRYQAIPIMPCSPDAMGLTIPHIVRQSALLAGTRWPSVRTKQAIFNRLYPEISTGDLFVARNKNQMVMYYPFSYFNSKRVATGIVPLQYNTCETLTVSMSRFCGGVVNEYTDHIDFYLNNFRSDTLTLMVDTIQVTGATTQPTYTMTNRGTSTAKRPTIVETWDEPSATYKLRVSHMGPLDISINCTGAMTERSDDYLPNTPLTLDLPVQPTDTIMPITIEAENMDYANIGQLVTDAYYQAADIRGHAAMGFVKMGTNTSASLRDYFRAPAAGRYTISIKYMASTAARMVFSGAGSKIVTMPATGTEWGYAQIEDVTLRAGLNTLTYKNSGGKNVYIDNITYIPSDELTPISYITSDTPTVATTTTIYNLAGQSLGTTQRGINIIRHADGTVQKVLVR